MPAYSIPISDKKDSGTKKSHMGIVRKEEIGYSKNSYQSEKQVTGVVCSMLSDSKFNSHLCLNFYWYTRHNYAIIMTKKGERYHATYYAY